jgi:hypothetical protein
MSPACRTPSAPITCAPQARGRPPRPAQPATARPGTGPPPAPRPPRPAGSYDPANPGQRDQPLLPEQLLNLSQVLLTAQETGQRCRQIMPRGRWPRRPAIQSPGSLPMAAAGPPDSPQPMALRGRKARGARATRPTMRARARADHRIHLGATGNGRSLSQKTAASGMDGSSCIATPTRGAASVRRTR